MQSLLRRWHPRGWLSATRKIYRLQVQKTMPERNLRYQGTAFLSGPKIQLFGDWGKRKKFQISSFINQKKTEDARLSFRFSFTSRSPLSFNSFPYYFQFTGPLLLTIVGETFVFASVEECRRVLKTYWWVVHSNLPVSCTVFCLFLWPDIRSQSERANSVIPRSPSLFLHITLQVV